LNKIVNDLLTGKDGKTHDIARWSWVITMGAVIAGVAVAVTSVPLFGITF